MGWPEQTSKIECYRQSGICLEVTAIVTPTHFVDARELSVEIHRYQIGRWDDAELVTEPLGKSTCTQQVRRINRVQQSVTGIRSRISTNELCEVVSESHLVLADGLEVSRKLQEKHGVNWFSLIQIAPSLLEIMNALKE